MRAAALPGIELDRPFELPFGARALFTSRESGNLSLAAGVGHEHGLARRERLARRLRLDWLCAAPQVHGTRVTRVERRTGGGGQPLREPADGHATALSGVGTTVLAADCVPVVLAGDGAVASVHAGWRGLADGVLEEGVEALRELIARESPLLGAIGPCAGACCYEVGGEVLSRFATELGLNGPARPERRERIDLRALVRGRLIAAGVEAVTDLDLCTICDERLFSHRREGSAAGRQAAVAWLP
ncbi:MAG: polyphenol oxidase family protein [Solirubrobacteraceae bacterium]